MAKNENTSQDELLKENEGIDTLAEDQEDSINFDDIIGIDKSFGYPDEQKAKEQPKEKTKEEVDNDKVRYQYFQSEYDKAKNKNAALEQRLAALEAMKTNPAPIIQEKVVVEETPPEAPVQPELPAYYNAADLADPTSDSFKYSTKVEKWRNDMLLHNQKLVEYTARQSQKKIDEILSKTQQEKKSQELRAVQARQLAALQVELKTKFKATDDQVMGFIKEMSEPSSLSVDNLWGLYAIKHDLPVGENKTRDRPLQSEPSAEFKQTERAQSLPNAMGVLPGISGAPEKSAEDIIMDKMLKMQELEDPFN